MAPVTKTIAMYSKWQYIHCHDHTHAGCQCCPLLVLLGSGAGRTTWETVASSDTRWLLWVMHTLSVKLMQIEIVGMFELALFRPLDAKWRDELSIKWRVSGLDGCSSQLHTLHHYCHRLYHGKPILSISTPVTTKLVGVAQISVGHFNTRLKRTWFSSPPCWTHWCGD